MKHWHNGKILNNDTKISSFNFALHYANPVVWEGIRAYLMNDGSVEAFKLEEHIQRLIDSAKIMGFTIPYSKQSMISGVQNLIKHFPKQDLYIRPIAYLDASCEGVTPASEQQINVDIYMIPFGSAHPKEGIKVATSFYKRGHPCHIMQAKTSANYGLLGLLKQECQRLGVSDMFITNIHGHYVEASVANIFIIKNNQVLTPRNNGDILPGITRATLCRDILMNPNIMIKKYNQMLPSIQEKDITNADIKTADEVFMCGTYAEVTPVLEFDGILIGNGVSGKITQILQNEYSSLVRGIK